MFVEMQLIFVEKCFHLQVHVAQSFAELFEKELLDGVPAIASKFHKPNLYHFVFQCIMWFTSYWL